MSAFLAFRAAAAATRPRVPYLPYQHWASIRNAHVGNHDRRPRNEEIKHRAVRLVDPDTGHLTELMPLRHVLARIDTPDLRRQFRVELVSEDPGPIVKIVNKKDAYEKRKLAVKKAAATAKANVEKEVQLTWGAAEGDFMHKMGRIKDDLEKGARVDLVFTHKKGQKVPTPIEMQEQARKVVAMVADVGAEWKPPEFKNGMGVIYLQSTAVREVEVTLDDLVPKKVKLRLMKEEKKAEKEKRKKIQEGTLHTTEDDLHQD